MTKITCGRTHFLAVIWGLGRDDNQLRSELDEQKFTYISTQNETGLDIRFFRYQRPNLAYPEFVDSSHRDRVLTHTWNAAQPGRCATKKDWSGLTFPFQLPWLPLLKWNPRNYSPMAKITHKNINTPQTLHRENYPLQPQFNLSLLILTQAGTASFFLLIKTFNDSLQGWQDL